MVMCRLTHGQRVTGGKILYVDKRRRGRSSSKKSHLKPVHLLFDDDGNAVNADGEGSTVTQRLKSFLQAVKNDYTDEGTSNEPLFSCDVVEDSLQTVCSDSERNSCSTDNIGNVEIVKTVESESRSTLSTADTMDAFSSCLDDTLHTAAGQLEKCSEELSTESEHNADCGSELAVNTSCCVASNDPDISKYWWQRYRLFSRFDSGIMIDRGL